METIKLVDMWILKNRTVDPTLPNCVCFERYPEVFGGAHTYTFRVCQYSSTPKRSYDEVPFESDFVSPVCVWHGNPDEARNIWGMFVSDGGWELIDAATPDGCAMAVQHLSACKYRDAISTVISDDKWSGAYAESGNRSDLASEFFLPSKYPNGIESYHPVTRMPRMAVKRSMRYNSNFRSNKNRRTRRSMFQTNSIPVHVQNTSQTDNYALGA